MGGGFVVGVFGVLVLAHAAYSTVQHRNLLKITEEEFSGPPFRVVIELLLGLMFCMLAALTVPGKFLSIHPDSDENRYKGSFYLLVIVFKKIYGRTVQLSTCIFADCFSTCESRLYDLQSSRQSMYYY